VREITETFFAADRSAWRQWLEQHHADKTEVWLVMLKKHVTGPCVSLSEAVEEALCFGWIDGHLQRIDDRSHALRFTPRRPGSTWAESNRARVERLTREGRMTAAGLEAVRVAKERGTWGEQAPERIDVTPPDLEAALAAQPAAAERWRAWPPSHRRQYVYWVVDAKRPQTRERRVAEVVRRAAAGVRPGDPPGP
jgi:uncharacterized protein YdeI (YjbR/CyaY-like superfamily)